MNAIPPTLLRTPAQLGAAVRRRRRSLGLTQTQLAERAGFRQSTISLLEQGEPGARLQTILDVLAALDLELCARSREGDAPSMEDLF